MVSLPLLASILGAGVGASKCTAFHSPARHSLMKAGCRPIICAKKIHGVALAENREGNIDIDSFLSSLPSLDDVKKNVLEGKAGERGEQYVIAQFSLFLFIAIGGLPLVGDALFSVLGPTLILSGLFLVYRSAVDLDNNLSPWPVPTQSGRGSLVDGGIYSYLRHPMYSGSLLGMAGLGLITDSVTRLFLTVLLYFVLDAKSDYEETKLIEKFGSDYEEYKMRVQGKFCPPNINSILKSNSRT